MEIAIKKYRVRPTEASRKEIEHVMDDERAKGRIVRNLNGLVE